MLKTDSLQDQALVDLIKNGAMGIIPTDTVYGLVCSAANEQAVSRLYSLKSRESKPGTVIAASVEQLVNLGMKARYLKPVEMYWPNPISVIIPNYELKYIHVGLGGIAVRLPDDKKLRILLEKVGPLLTSSANQPGEAEATTIKEAQDYFGADVDFYIDGGDLSDRRPSTLIRVVDDAVEVLRQGAVKIKEDGTIA